MSQSSATIERSVGERSATCTQAVLQDQLRLWAADSARPDEDDDILDSWLASLQPEDFDLFLNALAAAPAVEPYALQTTA